MSHLKMGFIKLVVFTALLLILKTCMVHGQGAIVEYISQPYSTPTVTTIQSAPSLVVPAIISPCITPYDSYIQESAPSVPSSNGFNGFNGYPSFAPSYPPPMPPIIIEEGNKNNWSQLLLFLIFAMRNRGNNGGGNGGGYSGGCNCNCRCGGGCNGGCGGYNGGYNSGYNSGFGGCGGGYDNSCSCGGYENYGGRSTGNNYGSGCSYIPYPIPVPINGPYSFGCGFPNYGYPDNSCGCGNDYHTGQGGNEISLVFRTEPNCS